MSVKQYCLREDEERLWDSLRSYKEKSELHAIEERLAWIDDHARGAPATATRSVSTLAAYLTGPVTSETLKARALFTWIAHHIRYDAAGFRAGTFGPQSAEAVLAQRMSVCAGYANLFLALAQNCRLEARIIGGWGKGVGFGVGRQVFQQPNHAWNAVRIDGQWRLLDSTWGAGYLSTAGQFVRAFNAHYFLTPPELFIYDHLPEDPQWQLLSPPISMPQFLDTVQTYPALFRYQVGLTTRQARLVVPNSLTLSFSAPADVAMMARLLRNGTELEPTLTFTQRENAQIVVRALLPHPGTYEVTLFAKTRQEAQYTSVLTYEVTANLATIGPVGFPQVYGAFDERAVRLYTPLQRHLRAGTPHLFQLEVPEATEVLISNNGAMTPLRRAGTLFRGEVTLHSGEVQVAIRLPHSATALDVVLASLAT